MSKTYFITSDVHSFYTPLMSALIEAGFDYDNPEHILVVNGDLFDRGEETSEVLNFIKSLPKEKRILIRGNHEYLLRDLLYKDMPDYYDFSNGTVKTVFHLANISTETSTEYYRLKVLSAESFYSQSFADAFGISSSDYRTLKAKWKRIQNKVIKTGILDWIFGDEWVDYYEFDNFIVTHAFIPVSSPKGMSMYRPDLSLCYPMKDWRTKGSIKDFEKATWGCPYDLYDHGFFNEELKKNKTLIVGHWHCYDFRQHYFNISYEKGTENADVFYSKNLIAIDACTAYTHKCNVLVIKDGKCYQHNTELKDELATDNLKHIM